jgi:hypothetical protein
MWPQAFRAAEQFNYTVRQFFERLSQVLDLFNVFLSVISARYMLQLCVATAVFRVCLDEDNMHGHQTL